jgi:hypothetical protein
MDSGLSPERGNHRSARLDPSNEGIAITTV